MSKTQKTIAVVSSLSASNSFASLTVKNAEDKCTMHNVPTSHVYNIPRKSRESSQKGLASDSKKMVLNSLLTPFDVSKSPESISTEEPVLKLRRSVTIEREVKVPVEVQGPAFPIKVDALLDSGATGCFIDKSWALERRIELKPLKNPIPVLNVDGTRNQAGDITHFVSIIIKIGKRGPLEPLPRPWSVFPTIRCSEECNQRWCKPQGPPPQSKQTDQRVTWIPLRKVSTVEHHPGKSPPSPLHIEMCPTLT